MKVIVRTNYEEPGEEVLTDKATQISSSMNGKQACIFFKDTDGHDKCQYIALDGKTEIIIS